MGIFDNINNFVNNTIQNATPYTETLNKLLRFDELPQRDRDIFLSQHAKLLDPYKGSPFAYLDAAEKLYNNQKFKDTFPNGEFDQLKVPGDEAYNLRNQLVRNKIINDAWEQYANPLTKQGDPTSFDPKKGLGNMYYELSQMSPEGRLELMNSGWLSPQRFEDGWQHQKDVYDGKKYTEDGKVYFDPWTQATRGGTLPAQDVFIRDAMLGNAAKTRAVAKNNRIKERIEVNDYKRQANTPEITQAVEDAYLDNSIVGGSDDETKNLFMKAINPDTDKNAVSYWGAYFGIGTNEGIEGEVANFTVDDMRKFLAKKKVYEENLSPDMAKKILTNEAQQYISDHQGLWTKAGLLSKDILVSASSYTADKFNGVYDIYLGAVDAFSGDPQVAINEAGEVVDTTKYTIQNNADGKPSYVDDKGNEHIVSYQGLSRVALHQMGKGADGSDYGNFWNPQYWSKAEQYGVFDEDLIKQYEKLGASPYKVAWDPGKDSDILYEAMKMASFGVADGLIQLVPWGIGAAGKALGGVQKLGKVGQGLGKVMEVTGNALGNAQAQGIFSAVGIAEAYGRGSFQETMQKNLTDAEELAFNKSRQDVYDRYHQDENYKNEVDAKIGAVAAQMKQEYIASLGEDADKKIADEETLDKMIRDRATQEVLNKEAENSYKQFKDTDEYRNLITEGINKAGNDFMTVVLPEAAKYSFVNIRGHRKWLYTNPQGVNRTMNRAFKGLREMTTKDGRKRIGVELKRNLTTKEKWAALGKTAGSQFWGGFWTNGTDDMMVDAAQQINEDSYARYLNAFDKGEALADTYGPIESLFSYFAGLENSLGQETTWNAGLIGGLGSFMSVTPNAVNIASLMTKEGRRHYRENFLERRVVDAEEGSYKKNRNDKEDTTGDIVRYKRNEDGSYVTEKISAKDNWRERLSFFLQNGILNTYYGAKQNRRDLEQHADYLNNILDTYDDFKEIGELIATDNALDNVANFGDEKTMKFIKAMQMLETVNRLSKDKEQPFNLSSVIQEAVNIAEALKEGNTEALTNEQKENLLKTYYSVNRGLSQNEENNTAALEVIGQNAKDLVKAAEAYKTAEEEISQIEKQNGRNYSLEVRERLKQQRALDPHWRDRVKKMKDEIGDTSESNASPKQGTLVASVGGRAQARELLNTYDRQVAEISEEIEKRESKTAELEKKLTEAQEAYNNAEADSKAETLRNLKEAAKEVDANQANIEYLRALRAKSIEKKQSLREDLAKDESAAKNAPAVLEAEERMQEVQEKQRLAERRQKEAETELVKEQKIEESVRKGKNLKERKDAQKRVAKAKQNVKTAREEAKAAQKEVEQAGLLAQQALETAYQENQSTVLTADEIFNLDAVSRARMLNKANRGLYSEEQRKEIEELEKRLEMRGNDVLQKVQDIALLEQRIAANEDAHWRISMHPEGAAYEFEAQEALAIKEADKLFYENNAHALNQLLMAIANDFKVGQELSKEQTAKALYRTLRMFNPKILELLDKANMLSDYVKIVDWTAFTSEIQSYFDWLRKSFGEAEEFNTFEEEIGRILEKSDSREQAIKGIEEGTNNSELQNKNLYTGLLKFLQKIKEERKKLTETPEERKAREEREKKEREEAERKNKEAAEEAERKAAEIKRQKEEDAMKLQEEEAAILEEELQAQTESAEAIDEIAALAGLEADRNTLSGKAALNIGAPVVLGRRIAIQSSLEIDAIKTPEDLFGVADKTSPVYAGITDGRALLRKQHGNYRYIDTRDGYHLIAFKPKGNSIEGAMTISFWRRLTSDEQAAIQELLEEEFGKYGVQPETSWEDLANKMDAIMHEEVHDLEEGFKQAQLEEKQKASQETHNSTLEAEVKSTDKKAAVVSEEKKHNKKAKAPLVPAGKTTALSTKEAIDVLVEWFDAFNKRDINELVDALDGTSFVIMGINEKGTPVKIIDWYAVEYALANYLKEKYPHLTFKDKVIGGRRTVVIESLRGDILEPHEFLHEASEGSARSVDFVLDENGVKELNKWIPIVYDYMQRHLEGFDEDLARDQLKVPPLYYNIIISNVLTNSYAKWEKGRIIPNADKIGELLNSDPTKNLRVQANHEWIHRNINALQNIYKEYRKTTTTPTSKEFIKFIQEKVSNNENLIRQLNSVLNYNLAEFDKILKQLEDNNKKENTAPTIKNTEVSSEDIKNIFLAYDNGGQIDARDQAKKYLENQKEGDPYYGKTVEDWDRALNHISLVISKRLNSGENIDFIVQSLQNSNQWHLLSAGGMLLINTVIQQLKEKLAQSSKVPDKAPATIPPPIPTRENKSGYTDREALDEVIKWFTMPGVKQENQLADALNGTIYVKNDGSEIPTLDWYTIELGVAAHLKEQHPNLNYEERGEGDNQTVVMISSEGKEITPHELLIGLFKKQPKYQKWVENTESSENQIVEQEGQEQASVASAIDALAAETDLIEREKLNPKKENTQNSNSQNIDNENSKETFKTDNSNKDNEYIESPTLEEEKEQLRAEGAVVVSGNFNNLEDVETSDASTEYSNEHDQNTLSGLSMPYYDMELLYEEKKLVFKPGKKEGDSREQFFAWMNEFVDSLGTKGILLHNIVSHELYRILEQNPHAKIKFMSVRPDNNATQDNRMKSHCLLVMDFNDSINPKITSIHNKDNGGVIMCDGKKYLIVGVAGYGNDRGARRDLYNNIFGKNPNDATRPGGYGLLVKEGNKYWNEHPGERFRVLENVTTEVVPNTLQAGRIARQLESDERTEHRSIQELLEDKEGLGRNPLHLKLEDLKFGIVMESQFFLPDVQLSQVMRLQDELSNIGRAMLLVPLSNGKYLPCPVWPCYYKEMLDGALKKEVSQLLRQLLSRKAEDRKAAIVSLSGIFLLNKDGDYILSTKKESKKNVITLSKDGIKFASFNLDADNFNPQNFFKVFEEQFNPRVNITGRVITSPDLLRKYDEAGALKVDIAMLHSIGSNYSIYPVDASGKMIVPETTNNSQIHKESNYKDSNGIQIPYKGKQYYYDKRKDTFTSITGEEITAQEENELRWNLHINTNSLSPSVTNVSYDFYVLESSEKPLIIKRHRQTKRVFEASETEKEFVRKQLEREREKADNQKRNDAAHMELSSMADAVEGQLTPLNADVEGELTGEMIEVDFNDEVSNEDESAPQNNTGSQEGTKENKQPTTMKESNPDSSLEAFNAPSTSDTSNIATQTFQDLLMDPTYSSTILTIISNKENSPITIEEGQFNFNSFEEIERYLRNKGVETEVIGTDASSIQAWLNTLMCML